MMLYFSIRGSHYLNFHSAHFDSVTTVTRDHYNSLITITTSPLLSPLSLLSLLSLRRKPPKKSLTDIELHLKVDYIILSLSLANITKNSTLKIIWV